MWIFLTIAAIWIILAIHISYKEGIKDIETRIGQDESINDWWERNGRDRWTGELRED